MSTDSDILKRAEQTPQAFAEAVVSMMGATMVTAPAIGSQMNAPEPRPTNAHSKTTSGTTPTETSVNAGGPVPSQPRARSHHPIRSERCMRPYPRPDRTGWRRLDRRFVSSI